MLRLLCVTAHPDDEAGFGGTLLLSKRRGIETYVTCLTPGQAASHRGEARTSEELAAIRRKEFAASCALLQVTRAEVLDYPDGRLDKLNFYEVVADLTRRIREIKPHVMLSYGTEGAITAHPDHSMASIFATAAFQWAGRSNRFAEQFQNESKPWRPRKLYYVTSQFILPERQPVALPPVTAFIDIGQDGMERKIEAFKMHKTQSPLHPIFETNARRHGATERFHLVASTDIREVKIEHDLFAGIEDGE